MGRPRGSATTGSLESGECKIVVTQEPGSEQVAGLRFSSQGKYVSFYANKEGLEALRQRVDQALKILKK